MLSVVFVYALSLIFGAETFIKLAGANASRVQEPTSCSTQGSSATSLSTTSVTYMKPGTGTSTATCIMSNAGEGTEVFDTAVLLLQFTGSSTASTLSITPEWSQDGIDWYPVIDKLATTTTPIGGNTAFSYTVGFASTTPGGQAGTSSVFTRAYELPVHTKRVRAVITMPAGSQNGAVWANIVGKTQIR